MNLPATLPREGAVNPLGSLGHTLTQRINTCSSLHLLVAEVDYYTYFSSFQKEKNYIFGYIQRW